jgi:hypothetical protein
MFAAVDKKLERELERLTANSAMRREDLLRSALAKSRAKKLLSILAGVLALLSAGAMTAVFSKLFGQEGLQYLAALIALVSGIISLFVTSYFGDDEILSRLAGSSKYLSLRDSVFRLAINEDIPDKQKFRLLADLQEEYSDLDSAYSKYFSLFRRGSTLSLQQLPLRHRVSEVRVREAAESDVEELHRRIERAG